MAAHALTGWTIEQKWQLKAAYNIIPRFRQSVNGMISNLVADL